MNDRQSELLRIQQKMLQQPHSWCFLMFLIWSLSKCRPAGTLVCMRSALLYILKIPSYPIHCPLLSPENRRNRYDR